MHDSFGLVLVILLGIAAQWIAWRLRVPSILFLLTFGILAGPILGWIRPDTLLGDLLLPVVSIAVGVILFEGGLTLKLSELRHISRPLLGLLTIGVLVTWGGAALMASWILGVSTSLAILVGAIVVVSGPTVVGPILLQVRPKARVASVARWEGIVIDPIGVLLAVIVFEIILARNTDATTTGAVLGLAKAIGVGLGLGLAGAFFIVQMLRRFWVPDHLHNPFVLSIVIGVLVGANSLQHEAGILAVTLMGFFLANQKSVPVKHIIEFKENLRVLLIAGIFILLAARLEMKAMEELLLTAPLFLAALILLIRPLATFVSTLGSQLELKERALLAWLAPRGIVAAAMASVLTFQLEAVGHPDAHLLVPIIFWVIIGTVFVYGLTVGPVARRLGLAHRNPQGVLFVGAHGWGREIAQAVSEAGFAVQLVDGNRTNVKKAHLAGLPAHHGNVLSEEILEDLDLHGIGKLVTLTANDEINALTALHWREVFPRTQVFQPGPREEDSERDSLPLNLSGRTAFNKTWSDLASRFSRGARARTTNLTETFDWESFQKHYGDLAVPLFLVDSAGKLRVFTDKEGPTPKPGDKVISLAQDPEDTPSGANAPKDTPDKKVPLPGPKPSPESRQPAATKGREERPS